MNFYCNSGGTIFHVDPERIFQGSAGVNTIRFIGQFPSSAQVLLAYKLPNGNLTSPKVLTLVDELAEVEAPDNGGKFSVWETVLGAVPRLDSNGRVLKDDNGNVVYDLDFTITENYGTATLQFFVYAASNSITVNGQVYNVKGGLLATASSNFTIEKGAPALIPTVEELTSTYAQVLLAEILNIISSNQTAYNNFTKEVTGKITAIEGSVNTALEEVAQVVENDKVQDAEIAEIRELVENAEQIAKGVQLAVSYADYSAMITALNALSANSYDVGQSIYIATLNVPDLWVYAIEATAVPYTYTSDEDFINSLLANGFVQAGHYKLAALETGKVAIGDYLEKSEFNEYLLNGLTNYPTEWTDEDKAKACETIGAVKAIVGEPDSGATRGFAYGLDSYGTTQKLFRVQIQANADTIPLRNPDGNFYVGNPTIPYECANKNYVDNLPDKITLTDEQKAKWRAFIGAAVGEAGIPSEEWIFTDENYSTITKKVYTELLSVAVNGTWLFEQEMVIDSTISFTEVHQEISFTSNGGSYSAMTFTRDSSMRLTVTYTSNDGNLLTVYENGAWLHDAYRYLTFASNSVVSELYYKILSQYAVHTSRA